MNGELRQVAKQQAPLKYKLIVFDLDETLWTVSDGLCNLIEPPFRMATPDRLVGQRGLWVELHPGVREMLKVFKERGAFVSLASRNDAEPTKKLLEFMGILDDLFEPQLCWKPKEESIEKIIKLLKKKEGVSVKPDEVLFIDDWPENISAVRRWGATALLYGQDVLSFEGLIKILD